MMEIKEQIQKVFSERFGDHGTMYASAGRINLIGEHTDYNGGFGGCTINLIKNELLEPFVAHAQNSRNAMATNLKSTRWSSAMAHVRFKTETI